MSALPKGPGGRKLPGCSTWERPRAVGLEPAKMDQVFALRTAGADIGVIVDNAVAARAAAERMASAAAAAWSSLG